MPTDYTKHDSPESMMDTTQEAGKAALYTASGALYEVTEDVGAWVISRRGNGGCELRFNRTEERDATGRAVYRMESALRDSSDAVHVYEAALTGVREQAARVGSLAGASGGELRGAGLMESKHSLEEIVGEARQRGELRRRVADAGGQAARGFIAEQQAAVAALNEELRPALEAGGETRVLVMSFTPSGAVKPFGLFAEADDARQELGIRFRGTWNEDRTRYTVTGNCGAAGYFELQTMRVQRFGD